MKLGTTLLCAAAALAFAGLAHAQDPSTQPAEQLTSTAEGQAPAEQAPAAAAEQQAPAEAAPQESAPTQTAPSTPLPEGVSAPPEGKGQIVFFRPSRFAGGALTFTVRENEVPLGRLPSGRYFVHVAEPGIHEYEAGNNDTMRMEIEPGETYYVMQNIQMGIVAGRAVLAPSDQGAFVEAQPRMRLSNPVN